MEDSHNQDGVCGVTSVGVYEGVCSRPEPSLDGKISSTMSEHLPNILSEIAAAAELLI